jgi:hypothetical protein
MTTHCGWGDNFFATRGKKGAHSSHSRSGKGNCLQLGCIGSCDDDWGVMLAEVRWRFLNVIVTSGNPAPLAVCLLVTFAFRSGRACADQRCTVASLQEM